MGMLVEVLTLLGEESLRTYLTVSLCSVPVLAVLSLVFFREADVHELSNLPLAGVTTPGYVGLLDSRQRFVRNGKEMLKEAYYKYRNRSFVMPTNCKDRIILTPAQVRELASAPDELVNLEKSAEHVMQTKYTGLRRFSGTGYIDYVVRTRLTRNLGRLREPMIDEVRFALETELPSCDDWTSLMLYPTALRIIARVSARAFVGFPLCRDEDWLKTSIRFTIDVFTTAYEIRAVPWFFRPFKAFFSHSARSIRRHRRLAKTRLTPIIEARLAEEAAAKMAGRPLKNYDDMLQWFQDIVKPEHQTPEALAELQLLTSMAAIHTSNKALINVLLGLASHPEYVQHLREEIEAVIKEDGKKLQKTTLRKMRKMDSFIKECFRTRMGLFTFSRKVVKSFTLSDGTFLPKGGLLAAPAVMFDLDPEFVEDPEVFDGFRAYNKNLESEGAGKLDKALCVTTTPSYLTFGHGKHACPGRFFAIDEVKLVLCHVLLHYDVKYGEGNPLLPDMTIGEAINPHPAQRLSFKKIPGPKEFDFL